MTNPNTPHFATLTVPVDKPLPASRHSAIEKVTDGVYMVRGRMPSTPSRPLFERLFQYYSRTMTIVRRENDAGGYDLTLINTLRMNDKALAELSKLGEVKHVVRLGSFHGIDDAVYLHKYGAKYWVVAGMENAPGLNVEPHVLSDVNLPIDGAQLFSFDALTFPEAIIVLPPTPQRAGVAITTDAVQNHRSVFDIDNSPLVSLAIWKIGLVGPARLGPIWLREQTPKAALEAELSGDEKKQRMIAFFRPQFERLLEDYDFEMLMPGHGWPIYEKARAAIRVSLDDQLLATK